MQQTQVKILQRLTAMERSGLAQQHSEADAPIEMGKAQSGSEVEASSNDEGDVQQSPAKQYEDMHASSSGQQIGQRQEPQKSLVLPVPSEPLTIENAITVEEAWDAWHGTTEAIPWKQVEKDSPCLSTIPETRRNTLQLLSKIGILMKVVQGNVRDDEVANNVSSAWNACQRSAEQALRQAGSEWILGGSIRTAYGKYLAFKKQNGQVVQSMESREVVLEQSEPIQPTLHAYYNPKGSLIDGTDVLSVPENEQYQLQEDNGEAAASVTLDAIAPLSQEICFVCPICPDAGRKRDYVVYRPCKKGGAKTLWQHWDREHKGQPKPALWKVQLVSGMKQENTRTAPWVRVENAASFRHDDYDMLMMREEVLARRRVLENGTYVELQSDQAARNSGIRWFAAIVDRRVCKDGKITVQWCEDNCQQLSANHIGRVYIESIIRVSAGEGRPFDDVPLSVAATSARHTPTKGQSSFSQLKAGAAAKSPLKRTSPAATPPKSSSVLQKAAQSQSTDGQAPLSRSMFLTQPEDPDCVRCGNRHGFKAALCTSIHDIDGNLCSQISEQENDFRIQTKLRLHFMSVAPEGLVARVTGDSELLRQGKPSTEVQQAASSTGKRTRHDAPGTSVHSPLNLTTVTYPGPSSPPPSTRQTRASSALSPIQQSQHSEAMPYQHEQEIKDIETHIARTTKNDADALKQFQAASSLVTKAGWSRCTSVEKHSVWKNIKHPDYKVLEIPRDGKCMYHCFLYILKAEGYTQAPTTASDLREALATYVESQVPPKGTEKGPYGGIFNYDGEYLHLEELLRSKYGGESAILVFAQLYDVAIHAHAPESRNSIVTFKGNTRNANEYHMLQTYSWKTWGLVVTKDPETAVVTTFYERNYAGDHWQILEPSSNCRPIKKLLFESEPATAASAASTAPRTMRSLDVNIDPTKLQFSATSTAPTSTRPKVAGIDTTKLEFSDSLAVQFMLRHVSGSNCFQRNPILDYKQVIACQGLH